MKATGVPKNPFRPGNGQKPVYLAGRDKEQSQFKTMVLDTTVSQNLIVTGLRGVGKTVLLDELKPIAQANGWLWTGNDLSESTSLTEDRIARRIVVDLSTKPFELQFHVGIGRAPNSLSQAEPSSHILGANVSNDVLEPPRGCGCTRGDCKTDRAYEESAELLEANHRQDTNKLERVPVFHSIHL